MRQFFVLFHVFGNVYTLFINVFFSEYFCNHGCLYIHACVGLPPCGQTALPQLRTTTTTASYTAQTRRKTIYRRYIGFFPAPPIFSLYFYCFFFFFALLTLPFNFLSLYSLRATCCTCIYIYIYLRLQRKMY